MRSSFAILAVLLAASMAMAQANTAPAPGSQPSRASPSAEHLETGGTGAAPAQAARAAGSQVLQAKSQEELKAYQDASTKTDPAEMEAAADAFAAKYPNSDLKGAPLCARDEPVRAEQQ